MRILHLAAGAGQMYCGACARDMVMARGLIQRGHDFEILPLYTPLRIEGEEPVRPHPVFLGGINAWLQQQSALFRHLPRWADRALDHPALLRWVSRFAISTKPADLGPMTVSVLAGSEGQQRKELDRLLDYLGTQPPPDLISITNSLLSGLAPTLKQRYSVPLVCGLQGEDDFVASLPPRYRDQAQEHMRRNAAAVDLFLSPGEAYAIQMAEFLGVPPERLRVVRPALDQATYHREGEAPREPFVIGYLSVITPRKGLDLLIKAWVKLRREYHLSCRLRVAGRPLDPAFLAQQQAFLRREGLAEEVQFLGEVDLPGKVRFLHQCSAFCVPSRFPESRAMAVMEAMAAGVPVVAPRSGIFPELFALVGGGLLCPPEDVDALAQALARIADDPEAAHPAAARQGLAVHYDPAAMAERLESLFQQLPAGLSSGG